MLFQTTEISGLIAVRLERFVDTRGSFARLFCEDEFASQKLPSKFVQQSLSVTKLTGTLRGMHFQRPPHAECKYVRCVRGSIYDVVADMRPASPSFLHWQAFCLTADDDLSLLIPKGCAHGFQTLTDDCEVLYEMDTPYHPKSANGFRYDDPTFRIAWAREVTVIADKDLTWPPFLPR